MSVHQPDDNGGLAGVHETLPGNGHGPHPDRRRGARPHEVAFGGDDGMQIDMIYWLAM